MPRDIKVHYNRFRERGRHTGLCKIRGITTHEQNEVTCRVCWFHILADVAPWARGFLDELRGKAPCSPADCWSKLTQVPPVDQPEGYKNLHDVKLYPARDEALEGLIRRAESCDRVTGYPATHGDLLSALRELRDRRRADEPGGKHG